jgi:hypothetical protein
VLMHLVQGETPGLAGCAALAGSVSLVLGLCLQRTCQQCVTCGEIPLFGHATTDMPLMMWVSGCVLQQVVDAAPVFSFNDAWPAF